MPAVKQLALKGLQDSVIPITVDFEAQRDLITTILAKPRDYAEGGMKAVKRAIVPGPDETHDEYQARLKHGRNIPLCKLGCAVYSDLAYGVSPTRDLWFRDQGPMPDVVTQATNREFNAAEFAATQALAEAVRDVYEANHLGALDAETAFNHCRDGLAWQKLFVIYTEPAPMGKKQRGPVDAIGISTFAPELLWPIFDPGNPQRMLAMVEHRPESKDVTLWTRDTVTEHLDYNLKPKPNSAGPVPHAWGGIPFVALGDPVKFYADPGACSFLVDAMETQKDAINLYSLLSAARREATWPILTGSGTALTETPATVTGNPGDSDGSGATPRTKFKSLWFREPDGKASYITPDFPHAEIRAEGEAILIQGARLDLMLPGDLVSGAGGPAEQPTTILFHWQMTLMQYRGLTRQCTAFEDQRMWLLLHAMAEYPVTAQYAAPSFDANEVDWDVRFRANPLPHDERADRELERNEVADRVRLRSQYIADHVLKDANPDELRRYLEALDAEQPSVAFLADERNAPPPPLEEAV